MSRELYQYLDQAIEIYVQRETRHPQCLAPWITGHTSIILKQLKTRKILLEREFSSYRKQQVQNLENLETHSS